MNILDIKAALDGNIYVSLGSRSDDGLQQLSDLRFRWEGLDKSHQVFEIITAYGEILVAIRNNYDKKYQLLRYFGLCAGWVVSKDGDVDTAEEVLDWLNNPRTL